MNFPMLVATIVQLDSLVERAVVRGFQLVTLGADEIPDIASFWLGVGQLQYGAIHVFLSANVVRTIIISIIAQII